MRKTVLVAVVSALVLTACACNPPIITNTTGANASVSVANGKIVVVPDPLSFGPGTQNVLITWQLPSSSGYTFPNDGIVISNPGDEIVNCHRVQNGLGFLCTNRHSKKGTYKYTIKVEGSPAVPPLDPVIVNN